MRNQVRPDVIRTLIDAYETVKPNLDQHASGYPDPEALRSVVASGQTSFGMAGVGTDMMTEGAELLLRAAGREDPRPLWVTVWGGANTLAQALLHARATRSAADLERLVQKLRVYAISDQDDAGPWIRREFPGLFYIAMPSTPDGDQYAMATWTGISGDEFYRNAPGADFTTFTRTWVDTHMRYAVVPGSREQRPRERDEPDVRRLGRALRVATVLRRIAPELDAGRRRLFRP
jgi:hypothetical protein